MLLGIIIIIVYGCVNVGGLGEVWAIASKYHRADFVNLSTDPYERHALVWVILNTTVGWMMVHGASQASVQRYTSLKTLRQAKLALLLNVPGVITLVSLACFAGVVIFANYADCDPLKAGAIDKKDQIIPYFVIDKLGHLTGLPGVFLACLFSGALSTLSSGLNALAAVTWEDGIRHLPFAKSISDKKTGNIIKLISVVYGVIAIGLAFVAGKLGGVLQVCITVTSVIGAPSLSLFFVSVLMPFVDKAGALIGTFASLAVSSLIGFGSFAVQVPGPIPLDSSVDGCPANMTISLTAPRPDVNWDELGIEKVFYVSYLLFMLIGVIVGVVVSALVSLITGKFSLSTDDPALVHGWTIRLCKSLGCRSARNSYDFGNHPMSRPSAFTDSRKAKTSMSSTTALVHSDSRQQSFEKVP